MTMSGGWRTVSNPNDVAGSHAVSLRKGARATVTASGRSFAVQAHKGPSFGYLGVFRGGKLIKRVDLYAPRLGIQRYPVFSTSTASDRTLTFRALGRKAPASSGRSVDVDAVYVTQ
jgi:hypothetical protein